MGCFFLKVPMYCHGYRVPIVWVSFWFPGLFPLSKYMPAGGLAKINNFLVNESVPTVTLTGIQLFMKVCFV